MPKLRSVVSKKIRSSSGKLISGKEKMKSRAFIHEDSIANAGSEDWSGWEDLLPVDGEPMEIDLMLEGMEEVPLSHAGGELAEILEGELRKERGMRKDTRNRRDRILKRTLGFQEVLDDMVNQYLEWRTCLGDKCYSDCAYSTNDGVVEQDKARENEGMEKPNTRESYTIMVVDLFSSYHTTISLSPEDRIPPALIRHGLVPCSPFRPTVAISIRTLELFRTASLRCPRLAIQNIVKVLCDLHSVPYKPHLTKQYTICHDLYLTILEQVDARLMKVLKRDSPRWRLSHSCPACTYALENEEALKFRLLFTMDGNDSLKRVLRCDSLLDYQEADSGGISLVRISNELPDQRHVGGDYYVSRSQVARWASAPNPSTSVPRSQKTKDQSSKISADEDDTPCSERWKNMSDQHTARAWGVFDETGIFVALCRHGFILLLTDMVQSGEGSQYPLAVVETLLDTFGSRLGGGYDIGCRFKTTLAKSELGPRVKDLGYTSLVGAFHGHAHNRICQLSHLATYVDGLGLSDLEGAERLFSRSNELASSTRHSSVFHRQQRIVSFFKHLDTTDTYESLSTFLINNYSAALQIIATTADFEKQMRDMGVEKECFKQWLHEEKVYLETLSKAPMQETLEIEYYRRLESLNKLSRDLSTIKQTWYMVTPTSANTSASKKNIEGERRRLENTYLKTLEMAHDLEKKLEINETWKEGDSNWTRVADLANTQQYRHCLDHLQQLVVSRMFELGKVNRSGTGYKLRQHISKALKTRSQAIKGALQRFNDAAKKLRPPRETLRLDDVLEYTFLSEFDILAETREDIRQRPWAQPVARTLMDRYFKIERAKEEISGLNVEIPRLITYMRDEEEFLQTMEQHMKAENPAIAYQISLRRRRFELANAEHLHRLEKLPTRAGFSGSLSPGNALQHIAGPLYSSLCRLEERSVPNVPKFKELNQEAREAEEEEEEDEKEAELGDDLEAVFSVLALV